MGAGFLMARDALARGVGDLPRLRVALVSSDTSADSGAGRCLLQLAVGLKAAGVEPFLYLAELGSIGEAARAAGLPVRITRLARGITTGSVLEFANKEILADALLGRQQL